VIRFDDAYRKLTDEQKSEAIGFNKLFADGNTSKNSRGEERHILQASYLRGTLGEVRAFSEQSPVVTFIADNKVQSCSFAEWFDWAGDSTVTQAPVPQPPTAIDVAAATRANVYTTGAKKTIPFEKPQTEAGKDVWKSAKRNVK